MESEPGRKSTNKMSKPRCWSCCPPYKNIKSFDELLDFGKFILNKELPVGGLGGGPPYKELKELNKYMFTTYSTNQNDKIYSLEGTIPFKLFNKIKKYLDHYYYNCIDTITGNIIESKLMDPQDYNSSMGSYPMVSSFLKGSEEDEFTYRHGWKTIAYNENQAIKMRDMKFHFFDFDSDSDSDELYTHVDEHLGSNNAPGTEVVLYIDCKYFTDENKLITLLIEDPVPGRTSLYRHLINILKN